MRRDTVELVKKAIAENRRAYVLATIGLKETRR